MAFNDTTRDSCWAADDVHAWVVGVQSKPCLLLPVVRQPADPRAAVDWYGILWSLPLLPKAVSEWRWNGRGGYGLWMQATYLGCIRSFFPKEANMERRDSVSKTAIKASWALECGICQDNVLV